MIDSQQPSVAERNAWFFLPHPVSRPRLRLFCFPYAGASASIFQHWPRQLPDNIEVCAIQLPGRTFRYKEPPLKRMEALLTALESVFSQTQYVISPFAFFGHSMGAVLAFELARQLRRNGHKQPIHLFLSGREPPDRTPVKCPIHALPRHEFLAELRRLKGTPEEVLANEELMALAESALRADYELLETWHNPVGPPLDIPLSVLGGRKDPNVECEKLMGWRAYSRNLFAVHLFPGEHFFIHSVEAHVLRVIRCALAAH